MIRLDDCSVVNDVDKFLKLHESIINGNRLKDRAKQPYIDRYNYVKSQLQQNNEKNN